MKTSRVRDAASLAPGSGLVEAPPGGVKPPPSQADKERFAALIPDPWWRNSAVNHLAAHQGPEADAAFKATWMADFMQYSLVSALLLTITCTLLTSPAVDMAEGRGTWVDRTFTYTSLAATFFCMMCISSGVINILFVNQIPPCHIYEYMSNMNERVGLFFGLPPLFYFWLAIFSMAPALSTGVYLFSGSAIRAWVTLGLLLLTVAMTALMTKSHAFYTLDFLRPTRAGK